jgi:hypothetical protein
MAAGPITQLSDIVEPAVFTPYIQQLTEEKSRVVQSGVLARNPLLDQLLGGGGLTFNVPSFRDLDNDADNVSGQDAADIQRHIATVGELSIGGPATIQDSTPMKTGADTEVAVRLNRNQSWSSSDLAAQLAGVDPMSSIGSRVAAYWTRRLQAIFINTMQGVSKDNGVNDSGDYANDISGVFADGVTNFSAEAALDTVLTMGDSMEDLTAMFVHSVVFNRMQKNNLIDFIPDARGEIQIPTFLGREVIVDDGMPSGANVVDGAGLAGGAGDYETWFFGAGAAQLGVGSPKVPTAVTREEQAGNGGGQEILFNRNEWSIHPTGHAYTGGTTNKGGPTNAELNVATAFNRIYPERKQIKFARLITTEA